MAGTETGLVAYWPFDEGMGQVVGDYSPNGSHGTLGDNSDPAGEGGDPSWVVSEAFIIYMDCNDNEVPDDCEIADGTSQDCNENGIPDECEFAGTVDCNDNDNIDLCEPGGTLDCNDNDVPDFCDVAAATSADCNENWIPDECEEDCNENGVPDDCDIDEGTSEDCDSNGVPDECQVAGMEVAISHVFRAYVDDNDLLIIQGNTLQWHHLPGGAAVGRHWGGSGNEPTMVDGLEWYPDWPEPPPATIDYEAWSSVYTDFAPPLPASSVQVELVALQVRDYLGIYGLPWSGNEYALTVEVDDPSSGPDWCEFEVIISYVPEEDCNENDVPDVCDIADGTSQDCNENGLPDECEPYEDCNENSVQDICDLAYGTS